MATDTAACVGTISPVEAIAVAAGLDRHIARMCSDDATLADVGSVLHLLGNLDVDPVRIQALCLLAARALSRYDAETRHASPAALAELIADARFPCGNAHRGCRLDVVEFSAVDGRYCSLTCRNEDAAATL